MASLLRPTKPVPVPPGSDVVVRNGKSFVRIGAGRRAAVYPLTADGTKYLKPSKKWYGKYTDGNGVVRKVPLTTDKSAANLMLGELVKKAERQRIGLFDPAEDHVRRPLVEHLNDYAAHLRQKGNCEEHVRGAVQQVRALTTGFGFVFLSDLSASAAAEWLHNLRSPKRVPELPTGPDQFTVSEAAKVLGLSLAGVRAAVQRNRLEATGAGKARRYPRATVQALADRAGGTTSPSTVNHYIRSIRGFINWLKKSKRIGSDPLDTLALLNEKVDVRHGRRELTVDELYRLLSAARSSTKAFRGLNGEDRFHLYLTAASTGLRAKALANLTPADFALASHTPTVTLAARFNKARKPKVQPLPADVAARLREYLATRSPAEVIWGGTWASARKAAMMFRVDLEAAGIPYVTGGPDGPEHADFHALRHTYLTMLGNHGVDLRTAQELAGHSRPDLTARYSHRRLNDLTGAVGKLPPLVPTFIPNSVPGRSSKTDSNAQCDLIRDVPGDVPAGCIPSHSDAPMCANERMDDLPGEVNVGPKNSDPALACTGSPLLAKGWLTGLEPATSGVTVRRSNQLSYSHRIPSNDTRSTTADKEVCRGFVPPFPPGF